VRADLRPAQHGQGRLVIASAKRPAFTMALVIFGC